MEMSKSFCDSSDTAAEAGAQAVKNKQPSTVTAGRQLPTVEPAVIKENLSRCGVDLKWSFGLQMPGEFRFDLTIGCYRKERGIFSGISKRADLSSWVGDLSYLTKSEDVTSSKYVAK